MIEAIVAVYRNWGIGLRGTQPLVVSEDRRYFLKVTGGSTVIVGRKTLADFPGGKPLKNRRNIILTHQDISVDGAEVAHTPEEALILAGEERTFVIGGESVYRAMLPFCSRVYVTEIDAEPECDAFFPPLTSDNGWFVSEAGPWKEQDGLRYRFAVYARKDTAE